MSAESLSVLQADNKALRSENDKLRGQLQAVQEQLSLIQRQLFGKKSERRHEIDLAMQGDLLADLVTEAPQPAPATEQISYRRRKKSRSGAVTESGLRFGPEVPVREIQLDCPEVEGLDASQYTVIDHKVHYKLAQRPAAYEVLKYVRPVVKIHGDECLHTARMPAGVLERSFADVSYLAGMLIDKFRFHLPLYRQHQRLAMAGIQISRQSLTNHARSAIELLRPVYDAQFRHVLQSKVLAIDETGIKAGRDPASHSMKSAYFWPIYGDADEMVFPFAPSKGFEELDLLGNWTGTLISDGAAVYNKLSKQVSEIEHATCWAHTRRYFERAQEANAEEASAALIYVGELYRLERQIRKRSLRGKKKHDYRLQHSKPIAAAFFEWCEAQATRSWSSADPIATALKYTLKRRLSLEVFLTDPAVPIDTNHLEGGLRPIPMGRKNYLFSWTELGAEHIGIIQSLLVTCRLHGVDPYAYLVDVFQRVSEHPANRAVELTPRCWQTLFADKAYRSLIDLR